MTDFVKPAVQIEEASSKRTIEDDNSQQKRSKPDVDGRKVVKESQVGITSYINRGNTGFLGTLKQLYSDFQVNEISLDGSVVHLNDDGLKMGKTNREKRLEQREKDRLELALKTPEEIEAIQDAKRLEEEQKKLELESKPEYELSEEDRTKLLELVTADELAQVEAIFTGGNTMETTSTYPEKDVRGKLHQLFRSAFQSKLETITSETNTFKVSLSKNKGGRGARQHPQESMYHVDDNGVVNYGLGHFKPFLHFTVYKENRETMEIASTISKFLRIPSKAIKFAGTKDRRGCTAQRFSIHRGKVIRVNSLNKALRSSTLGGFSYSDNSLGLGDLKGNEFLITIRNVRTDGDIEQTVSQCFESLQSKGFINYYGMQRFGSFSISTHVLGIYILKDDWKGAAELILSEQDVVAPDSIEGRRIWAETKDASLALKSMPRRFSAEHSILSVLEKEKPNSEKEYSSSSYFKAIMSIPKNLKIMYAHAYQSYIWNLVTSKRIELFGLEVQVGDLVYDVAESKPALEEDEDFLEEATVYRDVKVKAVTEEDIGKYTIYDVVLPTPGYKITYPANEQLLAVYKEAMAKDGMDPYDMKRKVNEFSLTGSYRLIVSKPGNLSYELVRYSEDFPLVKTELELLHEKQAAEEKLAAEKAAVKSDEAAQEGAEAIMIEEATKTVEATTEDVKEIDTSLRIIHQEGSEKLAIVLKMQLGVSSYATMALREFMKADTSRFGDALK